MTNEKKQLMKCIEDLALRSVELGESKLGICLFTLFAAGMTETDNAFAHWCQTFAEAQLEVIKKMNDKAKNFVDKPETP